MPSRLPHQATAALLLLAAAIPARGWAGVSGTVELGYGASDVRTTVPPEPTSVALSNQLTHRYRLNLVQQLFPKLSFNTTGSFEQAMTPSALSSVALAPPGQWNIAAALSLTDPMFGASADYVLISRGGQGTTVRTETPSAYLFWRPTNLPSLSLRVSQQRMFDPGRVTLDRTLTSAQLTSAWSPVKELDVGYGASVMNPDDRISGVATREFLHSGRASWSRKLFNDRTTVTTSLNVAQRLSQLVRTSPGALEETLRSPLRGGSAIEELPATTTDISLTPNSALWDGSTTSSSGVNLGYAPSVAGDVRSRHLGAEFIDPLTKLNRLHVYVDRELPPPVFGNFTWAAYRSDDGTLWTPVPVEGAVQFNALFNRFEIGIRETETRHVKVVTRPLAAGVTVDPQFREIFVTELQALYVTPIVASEPARAQTDASATASARTRITGDLSHDASLIVGVAAATVAPLRNTWALSNGLSWTRRLNETFVASARVGRVDSDYGRGTSGIFNYSASLSATPLPTANHALVYGGQLTRDLQGWATQNSVSLLNNLTPYKGVGVMASGTYSVLTGPQGRTSFSELLMLSATFQPHPRLTLTTGAAHNGSTTTLSGATLRSRQNRLEASASFSPFNTLYLSGGASWLVAEREPILLANSSIAFSPFQGGALQVAMSYSQLLDPSGAVGQYFSPSLRWTIRRGLLLNAAYTFFDSGRSVPRTATHTFSSSLQLLL